MLRLEQGSFCSWPRASASSFSAITHPHCAVACGSLQVNMDSMLTKIADADIVYGLHGAGLANSLYSRKGNVLVEIVGNYGGDSLFYTRVAVSLLRV